MKGSTGDGTELDGAVAGLTKCIKVDSNVRSSAMRELTAMWRVSQEFSNLYLVVGL